MNVVNSISFHGPDREEALPDFAPDFPYTASRAELDRYLEPFVPWHWHGAVELFYMESGALEYETAHERRAFTQGMAGMVNANVLHTTSFKPAQGRNVQLIHLFDPSLLSGGHGSRIEEKYILPLTADPSRELIAFSPEIAAEREIIQDIKDGFCIEESDWGYELRLREKLTSIWLNILKLTGAEAVGERTQDSEIKTMMIYVREHMDERIAIDDVAAAAHVSVRVCYRLFREQLHMSPLNYINECRLEKARRQLTDTRASIAQIAYDCGFGNSSGFGRAFRARYDQTPAEYRKRLAGSGNMSAEKK